MHLATTRASFHSNSSDGVSFHPHRRPYEGSENFSAVNENFLLAWFKKGCGTLCGSLYQLPTYKIWNQEGSRAFMSFTDALSAMGGSFLGLYYWPTTSISRQYYYTCFCISLLKWHSSGHASTPPYFSFGSSLIHGHYREASRHVAKSTFRSRPVIC